MSILMRKEEYSTFSTITTIWNLLKPYRGRFLSASFLRLLSDISWLYPAYAMASIVTFFSNYSPGESLEPFWLIMGTYAVISVFRFVSSYYAKYWGFSLSERAGIDAQMKTLDHVFLLEQSWHERENTGNKVKRINKGAEGVVRMIRMWFGMFIEIGVNLFGIIIIIGKFDRTIALMTIGFLVVYYFLSYFYRGKATLASQAENIQDEQVSGLLFEAVNNIRSVKVMAMIKPIADKLRFLNADLYGKAKARVFWNQSGASAKNVLAQLFRIGVLVFIGFEISQGRYEVGFLILFSSYFSNIQSAVTELADLSQEFSIHKYAIGRMTDILKVPVTTDIEQGKAPLPLGWKKIEVRNLSFSYGNKKVLDSLSFDIHRGEKIGVVGLSGAGKSTLFKLLLKENESYEGEILIDGVSLKTISKKDYYKHIAVVLQETEVFNMPLKVNIALSNYDNRDDAALLEKALTVAHVSEFAKSLPKGLDTEIGEKGVKLSGGERQRVGLARAIFKDPELLLLDEATSHLDVESEEKIQDSLHRFFQSVTAIVIAHRLTTIKEMDKILVLEGGRIIEQGSFRELDEKKGRFHELWEKQKL